jgi:hypothetical protein
MQKILLFISLGLISFLSFSQTPPGKVPSLTAVQDGLNNAITATWGPASNLPTGGYKIYYRTNNVTRESRLGLVTAANITGLQTNTNYKVWVRAFRPNLTIPGDTIYSAGIADTVNVPVITLASPTFSFENAGMTSTRISINITDPNPAETGFEVEFTGPSGPAIIQAVNTPINPAGGTRNSNFEGFAPKTSYSVRVRAIWNSLKGPWSSPASITTNPGIAPAPVASFLNTCPTFAAIKWTGDNTDVNTYAIERSTDNAVFSVIKDNLSNTENTYYDNGVVPGQNYWYKVVAINISGVSKSNAQQITVRSFVGPEKAQNIIALGGNNKSENKLTFQWTNGNEDQECKTNLRVENFVFVRYNGQGDFVLLEKLPPFATKIVINNLQPRTKVDVIVRSVSDKGILSQDAFGVDETYGPPSTAPTNIKGVFLKNALNQPYMSLTWDYTGRFIGVNGFGERVNVPDHNYFVIERSKDGENNFKEIARIKEPFQSLIDMDMEEGDIYYYRIKAGNEFKDGVASQPAGPFLIAYTTVPNAPWGLKSSVSGLKVTLNWQDASTTEEGFVIQKSQDNGASYTQVGTVKKNIITYTDENVTAGKTYLYRVKAENSAGSSKFSVPLSVIIPAAAGFIPEFNIYPNPSVDNLRFLNNGYFEENENLIVQIKDGFNKTLFQRNVKSVELENLEINLSQYISGTYFVVIGSDQRKIQKKIIKQ